MSSEASKVRFVKCPKCRRLLTEFADIPVYRCGGCGTVLQAKNRRANEGNGAVQLLGSISSEKNLLQPISETRDSSSDEQALLNRESSAFSSASNDTDTAHMEEHGHTSVSHENGSCSGSEDRYHKVEETSEHRENEGTEVGLRDESTSSTGQPSVPAKETTPKASDLQGKNIQVNMDSCSNERQDNSPKLSEPESVNSCSSCKIGATESCLVSEDIVDVDRGSTSSQKTNSPTARSAHAYDGNDSLCDAVPNSQEECLIMSPASRGEKVSGFKNTEEKDEEENMLLGDVEDLRSHRQSRSLSSNSFNERFASLISCRTSDSNCRSSSNHVYSRGNSRHSEIFHSARKELEDDPSSTSISRDSSFRNLPWNGKNDSPTRLKNLENDRMELLRKVDELRDHLTRQYTLGQERNQRSHIQGTRQDSHWPLFCNHGSEKLLQCCISYPTQTQNHPRFSEQSYTAQPYQSVQVPFSAHGCDSCLRRHPEDWCLPPQLPHDSGCRTCIYHAFCHSSTSSSQSCFKDCNASLHSHKSQTNDQHFEKLQYKEKKQPLKHHCRPVSGGAPFVICTKCMQLLHLPADFLVSKARYHKLKCGGCSEVLIFLSHGGGHIRPHAGTQLDPAPTEVESATEHVRRDELSVDRSCDYLQGDPVSYSDEYGPPFSIGYSTDGEPVPHIVRNSLQHENRRHGKQAIDSTLHRLMGYESATELIYQPSDDDEGYVSTDMARFYGTTHEIYFNEVHREPGMGCTSQGHSEAGSSPEYTGAHEEDGTLKRSVNRRGGTPLHGFLKKGIKELNHGLESLKLKRHTGARVIPAP